MYQVYILSICIKYIYINSLKTTKKQKYLYILNCISM